MAVSLAFDSERMLINVPSGFEFGAYPHSVVMKLTDYELRLLTMVRALPEFLVRCAQFALHSLEAEKNGFSISDLFNLFQQILPRCSQIHQTMCEYLMSLKNGTVQHPSTYRSVALHEGFVLPPMPTVFRAVVLGRSHICMLVHLLGHAHMEAQYMLYELEKNCIVPSTASRLLQ